MSDCWQSAVLDPMAQRLTRVRPVALVTFGHVEGDVVHSQCCVLDLLPQFAAVNRNIDEQAETLAWDTTAKLRQCLVCQEARFEWR